MKFLNDTFNRKDIMPLNIYYNRGSHNWAVPDDVIDIIFKDMETGSKYVETITNPIIEIWVVKPEFRNKYTFIHDYYPKPECFPILVHYKNRFAELSKALNIPMDDVKTCPWMCQLDMDIRHFYLMQFILEYGNKKFKRLSCGWMDIETDIINIDTFPEPGEVPINAVTYIDVDRMQVYTFLLSTNNIRIYDKPLCNDSDLAMIKYKKRLELKENFDIKFEEFRNHIPEFLDEVHSTFDESYPGLKYNILIFDKEIDLLTTLWKVIRASDNDYLGIWNLPFDMQFMMTRPKMLGYDPNSIIVDYENFGERTIEFYEDRNPMAHKRKHKCSTFTKTTFVDQLVVYGGIRSGKSKMQSLKLNSVGKAELKDTKLDYSEDGDLRHLPYVNYKRFVIYNIKDVLLQYGLDKKTKDFQTMYSNIYKNAVLPSEIFTSTTKLQQSMRMFFVTDGDGTLLGSNRNKLFPPTEFNLADYLDEPTDSDLEESDEDGDDEEIGDIEEESVIDPAKKKKDKFAGAHVQNPQRIQPTGSTILGSPAKYYHKHVPDMDITSEYPTAIIIMNCSNDTMVGKFILVNPEDVKLKVYGNFKLYKKDPDYSKIDVSNAVMEYYSQQDDLSFGTAVLRLPSPDQCIIDIEAIGIEKFLV